MKILARFRAAWRALAGARVGVRVVVRPVVTVGVGGADPDALSDEINRRIKAYVGRGRV